VIPDDEAHLIALWQQGRSHDVAGPPDTGVLAITFRVGAAWGRGLARALSASHPGAGRSIGLEKGVKA
jgi:hypothetical protein